MEFLSELPFHLQMAALCSFQSIPHTHRLYNQHQQQPSMTSFLQTYPFCQAFRYNDNTIMRIRRKLTSMNVLWIGNWWTLLAYAPADAACALTWWQHSSVWNNVLAAILKVWHHIRNPTTPIDELLEERRRRRRRRHRVASSDRRVAPPWPRSRDASRGCHGQPQCRGDVCLSSEHEDDQVDVSSPDQVNGGMPGRLDNVGHRLLEPLGWAELCVGGQMQWRF